MELTLVLGVIVALAAGWVGGIFWYKYQLENHPDKLGDWLDRFYAGKATVSDTVSRSVQSIQAFGDKVEREIDDATSSAVASMKAASSEKFITAMEEALESAKAKIRNAVGK